MAGFNVRGRGGWRGVLGRDDEGGGRDGEGVEEVVEDPGAEAACCAREADLEVGGQHVSYGILRCFWRALSARRLEEFWLHGCWSTGGSIGLV